MRLDTMLLVCMTLLFSWQSPCARLYTENYAGPRKGDASNVYAMFYGAVIAVLSLAVNGFRFDASLPTLLLGLVNGGVLIVYTTSLVHASVLGPYSFLMLCSLTGGLMVPMVCSTLFMGESLTGLQLFAVGLMLLAFVGMNLQGLSFKGQKPKKAFFLWCGALLLSNGFYGQLINIQQSYTGGAERAEMVVVTYATTAIAVFLWRLAAKSKELAGGFKMGKKSLLFACLACLIATTATNLLVYLITALESVTVLFAINNGGVLLLSGVYSLLVFHEKPTASQIAGMALALVSIVLLNL